MMTKRPALKYRSLLTLLVVGCFAAGLSGADSDVFDSDGVKIHYVTAGSGEAVVLIHGGNETDYVNRVAAVRALLGRGELRSI